MNRSIRALAHKYYLLIWVGSLLSNLGNWIQNVAEGWVVANQTHSAFLVELISFAQFIPVLFLVIPAGILADKYNRKKVLLAAQLFMCLIAVILAVTAHFNLITPYFLIFMTLFEGTGWAIGGPTWHTVIPNLVPRADLESAISLNSIQYNLARLLGPAIAGFVIAHFGIAWAFNLNVVSFLAVIFAIALVKLPQVEKIHHVELTTFKQARHWIKSHNGAKRIIYTITLFALCSAPIQGLMPFFATDVFHVSAKGLGYLLSSLGGGAVVGAFLVGTLPSDYPRHHLIPLSMIVLGSLMVLFSQIKLFPLACFVMFFIGIFWLWTMVSCNTAMQLLVPDRMRGRVMSVLLMAHVGMLPLGHLIAGVLATYINPRNTMGIASCGLLLCGIYTFAKREPSVDGIPYTPHKIQLRHLFSDVILATPYRIHHKKLAAEKIATPSSDLV